MVSPFAAIKANARAAVHAAFAVSGTYTTPDRTASFDISVRVHGKMGITADLESSGWASSMVSISRLVFSRDELAVANNGNPLVLSEGGTVKINDPGYEDLFYELQGMDEIDGPVTERWSVLQRKVSS